MLERMTEESPTKPGARFEASFQYSPKMIKLQQQTGDQKLRSRTLRPHAAIRESREHTGFTSSPPGSDDLHLDSASPYYWTSFSSFVKE